MIRRNVRRRCTTAGSKALPTYGCRVLRDRIYRCTSAPAIAATLLLACTWSHPANAQDTAPCVQVAAASGTSADPETMRLVERFLVDAVDCGLTRGIRATVGLNAGVAKLRARAEDLEGKVFYALHVDCSEATGGGLPCVENWAQGVGAMLRSREATRLSERALSPDWFRLAFLVGTTGAIGGRAALVTLKFDGGYLTPLQGGAVFRLWGAGSQRDLGFTFVGPEGGAVYRRGGHWLSIGAQLGFGAQMNGTLSKRVPLASDGPIGIMGILITPTIRYRYYWGLFGLEASVEWPVVLGGAGVATPWPIVGLSVGF